MNNCIPKDFEAQCRAHFEKACNKHPEFVKNLEYLVPESRRIVLDEIRKTIVQNEEADDLDLEQVLECEENEMLLAIGQGNAEHAIDEAYDAIAVIMRAICRLETEPCKPVTDEDGEA